MNRTHRLGTRLSRARPLHLLTSTCNTAGVWQAEKDGLSDVAGLRKPPSKSSPMQLVTQQERRHGYEQDPDSHCMLMSEYQNSWLHSCIPERSCGGIGGLPIRLRGSSASLHYPNVEKNCQDTVL